MIIKNTSPELYAWHYRCLYVILQAADNFDQKTTLHSARFSQTAGWATRAYNTND